MEIPKGHGLERKQVVCCFRGQGIEWGTWSLCPRSADRMRRSRSVTVEGSYVCLREEEGRWRKPPVWELDPKPYQSSDLTH